MLHSLAQRFPQSAMAAILLSVVCSGKVSGQVHHASTPHLSPSATTLPASKAQTPEQQVLVPFLKAHLAPVSPALRVATNSEQPRATSYATTPPFGGYVNAPN
jgi:hypothetical protein